MRHPQRSVLTLSLLLIILSVLASCGYRTPYSNTTQVITLHNWKNRTNELQITAEISNRLAEWYQKTSMVTTNGDTKTADLVLSGEIISIDKPILSYNTNNVANQIKVKLRLRYILKDLHSEKILIEEPGRTWIQTYLTANNAVQTRANYYAAIDEIVEKLCEEIYQRTLMALSVEQATK